MFTWFPSITPFGLTLGPANPAQISFTQEPLDFRREGLSPSLSLLMSAFSLPIPPPDLTIELHRLTERSATACLRTPIPSANGLSPVTFSAQDRLTSELLRFL